MKYIVVDVLGGDLGIGVILDGIKSLIPTLDEGYKLVLVGPKSEITKVINEEDVVIVDASYDVSSDANPMKMRSEFTDSALMKSLMFLKNNDDAVGLVSMSSTGCLLIGSLFEIRLIKNIKAAVLVSCLLTDKYKNFCLLDCGANIDVNEHQLFDFAKLGNAFMKSFYNLESPKIGLANVGVEEKKGTKVIKCTYDLLKESNLNFIGNIEFSNVFTSDMDVLVCDGFTGNNILKNSEAVANVIMNLANKHNASDELKNEIYRLFDYNSQGGATLLGLNKIVVKAHGACTASTIIATINQVIALDKGNLIENLKEEFNE